MLSGDPLERELRPPCCRENHPDQAIGGYVEADALAVLAEEFDLRTAVVINEENILTVVAALNNVVRRDPQ